ncbi:MAG: MopE-related protein [Pseudomonadota bacterium]|nr:MopE-related protein [Pseudomonadota bacterium]
MRLSLLALLTLTACPTPEAEPKGEDTSVVTDDTDTSDTEDTVDTEDTDVGNPPRDVDEDGFDVASGDCDDADASVFPGAPERCNEVDDDWDGVIDPATSIDAPLFFADLDGDGFGDATSSARSCTVEPGWSLNAGDCDDADAAFNPGVVETDCADPNDYNCDGSVGYADADADGTAACRDCDDADASTFPGAAEVCNDRDDDCDGNIDLDALDASTWHADGDGDTYGDAGTVALACDAPSGFVADATDCDDASATAFPGAEEACNEVDDDCDGVIDPASSVDAWTLFVDLDGDGFGDTTVTERSCTIASGWSTHDGDCDDADAAYNPGAAEADCADPADYNCDGAVGYADGDADGFAACEECDDADASTFPGADEVCNDRDDDCDGSIDGDSLDASLWYADVDGDTFGDVGTAALACAAPRGFIADASDCDDEAAVVYPGAPEVCNERDDDCDATSDEDATDASRWYADVDADGFGDPADVVFGCSAPLGRVANAEDCDDSDAAVSPRGVEVCNEVDDDCDGTIDPSSALGASTWYSDADVDGFGDLAESVVACSAPERFVADATDCDPASGRAFPGAPEICNGVDDDCDGVIDPASSLDARLLFIDEDGDGFGDVTLSEHSCTPVSGWVASAGDCDDSDPAYNPAAVEADCTDASDYNCDGSVGYFDTDGDGTAACEDCNDADADVFPGADEVCNDRDDDCDGTIDLDALDASVWHADLDGDTFGDAAGTSATLALACDAPIGFVADATDCDDDTKSTHPGAEEVCNGLDDDCDGTADPSSATDAITWFADVDADGHGDASDAVSSCSAPGGRVAHAGDCNDSDAAYNPTAAERDCTDPNDYNCDGSVLYADADGDGTAACVDCDDEDARAFPGAPEVCNDRDDDCDGAIDLDAVDAISWYADADADGAGDTESTMMACAIPLGFVATGGDCDDTDAGAVPGGDELCDGTDNDCNGVVDDASAADAVTWYSDADRDGYGNPADADISCEQPLGYVADDTDCVDGSALYYPGAAERCDGGDNDCNGIVDESPIDGSAWFADADSDGAGDPSSIQLACVSPLGYLADALDCDDTDGAVFPGASEQCNDQDDDCDGAVDEDAIDAATFYQDLDGDGIGVESDATIGCDAPEGHTTTFGDCADDDADTFPGAPEVCGDAMDQDCSGVADDDGGCYGCSPVDGFIVCEVPSAWDAASYTCEMFGFQLVTVNDADEHAALSAAVNGYVSVAWIGLSDLVVEGEWTWEDGTLATFTAWGEGEPNDVGASGEDCANASNFDGAGSWNDYPCDQELPFICE